MIFNDFDIWEKAFKSMKLNENVQFVSRGRLIIEESQVEMFNKINALLNCNAMETSHKFLFGLDPTELNENETTKVNNLYNLACEKGFIAVDKPEEEVIIDEPAKEEVVMQQPVQQPEPQVPTAAFTVLYSAMRDGAIKTGEAYSNSINTRSAKADIIGQLERAGYSQIKILAIECGDPDDCGKDCVNTFYKQADTTPIKAITDEIPDYSNDVVTFEDDELQEADDKEDDGDEEASDDKEDTSDEETSDEDTADEETDDSEEDSTDDEETSDDEETEDSEEDDEEAEKEEKAEEPDEKLKDDSDDKAEEASDKEKEDKELNAAEKTALKDSYKKAFKAAMLKCKFEDKSFDDLSLEEKVKFFTELSKAWGSKADPVKFMSDKELEQLESIVVKK